MDPNQYTYTSFAGQPPPYQPYNTQGVSDEYNSSRQHAFHVQTSYLQPHYGVALPPSSFAELPPALPSALPTTTSPQQLNEDELLAHKLQNVEVEEARRISSSTVSLQQSRYSLRDAVSSTPWTPQDRLDTPPPALPPRPHSERFSPMPFYGPDSFGPIPATFQTNEGRMLMAASSGNDDHPPPTPHVQSMLPEVVVAARPVTETGLELAANIYVSRGHREVPYPPQWRLPPVVDTLYASSTRASKSTDWLDPPLSREWRRARASQHEVTPTEPNYSFTFKSSGGSIRDPRYMWKMQPGHWTYNLRLNDMTGLRKSETLTTPEGIDLITTYISGANYDSLRLLGSDGRVYLWVAHAPLSSTNGARYDTLRHALFMAPKGRDPLYGEIVADHTYWDGVTDYSEVHRVTCDGCGASPINGLRWKCKACADHDICEQCRLANKSIKSNCSFTLANLPDEALYIRSSRVDSALVCATLQIMKDWELHMLRSQRKRDPKGFQVSEDLARKGDLGRLTYWKSSDGPSKIMRVMKAQEQEDDSSKIAKMEKAKAKENEKADKRKVKMKEKERSKKGTVVRVTELVRGSAQIGGSLADIGDSLLRSQSRSSTST